MRKSLFSLLLLSAITAPAQEARPAPKLPFTQSIAVNVGIPMLFGEKENGSSGGFLSIFPSRSIALSLNFFKGFSLKSGLWRASYLSPRIPEGYDDHAFLSFGEANKVYDHASGSYLLAAYEYYLPLTHKPLDIKVGILLQPAAGLGFTRLREAYFTVHVPSSSSGGMGFFNFKEQTHDYRYIETSVSGFAAQLGIYGYAAVNRKLLICLGPTFFTMPGSSKQIYGAEIGLGLSVAIQK